MTSRSVTVDLTRYLLMQHVTPHSLTGKSPAELLMGRKLKTLLDKVYPDFTKEMSEKHEKNTSQKRTRQFDQGDAVLARAYGTGEKWVPSTVLKSTGPLSYNAVTPERKIIRLAAKS